MKPGITKLNLLISYPVKWSVYEVMRDFVQNFYDAIGYEKFASEFKYEYLSTKLVMKSKSTFDIDYLYYMGTSTKRSKENVTAGGFGEGFKIAALVAYRDYGYDITMESGNWKLKVSEEDGKIDNKDVRCLAYVETEREDDGLSVLTLNNVPEKDYSKFLDCIKDYFYVGNPCIGRCIAEHNGYGIYESIDSSCGKVFSKFQLRYSIKDFPYVFTNPAFAPPYDDRDRNEFRSRDALKCALEVVYELTDKEAFEFLNITRRYWTVNRKKGAFDTYKIISDLIMIVSFSKSLRSKFRQLYENTLVADFPYSIDRDRKVTAIRWYSAWKGKTSRKVVYREFAYLGIPTIEMLCEREGGFEILRDPTDIEHRYISILERTVRELFPNLVLYDEYPKTSIIINKSSYAQGTAKCTVHKVKRANEAGIRVKRDITHLDLKAELFAEHQFPKAITTYLHELMHQFGSDSDPNFHKALHLMNIRLPEVLAELGKFEDEWNDLEGVCDAG